MTKLIAPHGGVLINRILTGAQRDEAIQEAKSLKEIIINEREISDLEMLATGALSPLTGFMKSDDYDKVLDNMRLANGLPWTVPVTLSTSKDFADTLKINEKVALYDDKKTLLALMRIEDKYAHQKEKEAMEVYGTKEEAHPGVAALNQMGEILIGGEIFVINKPSYPDFNEYRLDPAETREEFKKRGWKRIAGFQTRNPIHRAHEYLQKCAMEVVDGLFLHPLMGATQKGDIPGDVRMACYKAIVENYYPQDRVMIGIFPAAMRYAGPKEAIFHAIVRKNYGCSHFIVGRDHAGVGKYYGTFDAHYIFDEFEAEELDITPLFFDYSFFCKKCGNMASYKTCPHGDEDHISLSGTKVREMLGQGIIPPIEFTRPEVAKILIESYSKE